MSETQSVCKHCQQPIDFPGQLCPMGRINCVAEPASTGEPPPKCTKCGGNLVALPTVHCPKCASTNFLTGAARPSEPSDQSEWFKKCIKEGADCDCVGDCKYKPAAPQTSAELPKCLRCDAKECSHGKCPNCDRPCRKCAAPQPVSGDAPKVEEIARLMYEANGSPSGPWEMFDKERRGYAKAGWLINAKVALESLRCYFPPASQTDDKRVENTFDKLADQGFFEDVKDWPQGSRDECMEILTALATPASTALSASDFWREYYKSDPNFPPSEAACDFAEAYAAKKFPAPASTARTDGWEKALRELADCGDCDCDHDDENCCAKLHIPCAQCTAAVALAEAGIMDYIGEPAAPGSVPQAPKCSEPRVVELNPPNAPDKYAVFIGKVFIREFDYEKEAEELRDNLKRGVPQAEPPNGRAKAEVDMLDASEEASYREKFEGR